MRRRDRIGKAAALIGLSLALAACAAAPERRSDSADELARAAGWHKTVLRTQSFTLASYGPPPAVGSPPGSTLAVFIEGDGLAWTTQSRPSRNPTPRDPVALKIALRHEAAPAAYLARPCQYVTGQDFDGCRTADWTNARFSADAVAATNDALTQLKARYGAQDLILVGYSGGGAIALLAAAQRSDVRRIVTIAAILDHAAWTSVHAVSPLSASLNPADVMARLAGVAQVHLSGTDDDVVPPALVRSYTARMPAQSAARFIAIEDFDHACCWAAQWRGIWRYAADAAPPQRGIERVTLTRSGALSPIP